MRLGSLERAVHLPLQVKTMWHAARFASTEIGPISSLCGNQISAAGHMTIPEILKELQRDTGKFSQAARARLPMHGMQRHCKV
jgi:hypothetical protein